MRKRNNKTAYECSICKRKFRLKYNINKHLIDKHGKP